MHYFFFNKTEFCIFLFINNLNTVSYSCLPFSKQNTIWNCQAIWSISVAYIFQMHFICRAELFSASFATFFYFLVPRCFWVVKIRIKYPCRVTVTVISQSHKGSNGSQGAIFMWTQLSFVCTGILWRKFIVVALYKVKVQPTVL